jgi:hypothetical protein
VRSEKNSRSPESQRARMLKRIWIVYPEGSVATDRELWVEALRENAKEKSLKSLKPEYLNHPRIFDLQEDTCHQIPDSG